MTFSLRGVLSTVLVCDEGACVVSVSWLWVHSFVWRLGIAHKLDALAFRSYLRCSWSDQSFPFIYYHFALARGDVGDAHLVVHVGSPVVVGGNINLSKGRYHVVARATLMQFGHIYVLGVLQVRRAPVVVDHWCHCLLVEDVIVWVKVHLGNVFSCFPESRGVIDLSASHLLKTVEGDAWRLFEFGACYSYSLQRPRLTVSFVKSGTLACPGSALWTVCASSSSIWHLAPDQALAHKLDSCSRACLLYTLSIVQSWRHISRHVWIQLQGLFVELAAQIILEGSYSAHLCCSFFVIESGSDLPQARVAKALVNRWFVSKRAGHLLMVFLIEVHFQNWSQIQIRI